MKNRPSGPLETEVKVEHGAGRGWNLRRRVVRLTPAPPIHLDISLNRDTARHPVQPATQRVAVTDRTSLAGQDKKSGLEGVFDVVVALQDGTTGGRDHRAVPRHQGGEGRPVVRGDVSGQELAVGETHGRATAK
jgi:hypothetical protein